MTDESWERFLVMEILFVMSVLESKPEDSQ
jgi:hypothetical protein